MKLVRLLKGALIGGALLFALAQPTFAKAGTVGVEETRGTYGYEEEVHFANLRFTAAAGENNAVAVRTVTAEHGLHLILEVTDSGAPITAGSGCSTGNPGGNYVWCDVPYPRGPEYVLGPFKSATPVPGSRWVGLMTIDLGDGRNSFEDARFGAAEDISFAATVIAGAGDDRIVTGGGADLIDPGAGADFVQTNDSPDRVMATAMPDGPDVYDLGTDHYPAGVGADAVDYSARSAPVEWDAQSGLVAVEGDQLTEVHNVVGGSGDDVLRGNEREDFLVGGPGNDLLLGGSNWDVLEGGDGNDTLRGGGDTDALRGGDGDDTAYGGRDHDAIRCGAGWDQALAIDGDRQSRCEALRFRDGSGLDSLLPSG